METISIDFNWKATDLGPVLAILMALVFFVCIGLLPNRIE